MSFETISAAALRLLVPVFAVVSLSLLGGCAATDGYPGDPQSPGEFGSTVRLEELRTLYFSKDVEDCYRKSDCQEKFSLKDKTKIRDEIVLGRTRVYDMEFSRFVRKLSGANNTISLGSDLTALALDGLAATTGDAGTKAALAAASGGVLAANGAVNKDLFYQKTVPAIVAQMTADRQKVEVTILQSLKGSDDEYPLQRAMIDLNTLNDAGSLNSAIASITEKSSTEQSSAQSSIAATTIARTANSKKIQAWLYSPATGLNMGNWNTLQNWLNERLKTNAGLKGVQPGTFATALSPPDVDLERAQAINDLHIS